jgi:hypothetical protein
MARNDLTDLFGSFYRETENLVDAFDAGGKIGCLRPARPCREYCAIRLHDVWARYCRELVIRSASERPLTLSGTALPMAPSINRRADVLPRLRVLFSEKRRWWEPDWADQVVCIEAANRLAVANHSSISAGVGLTPSPVEDIRRVRNFLAHRQRWTAQFVAKLSESRGLPAVCLPERVLVSRGSGGDVLFTEWVQQLRDMARVAAG